MCALTDQTTLELRESCKHMEDQLAHCAVRFDLLGKVLEANSRALQLGHDLHEIRQAQPPNPQHLRIAVAQSLTALLQLYARSVPSAYRFFIDYMAPSLLKHIGCKLRCWSSVETRA